jgi:class 3 adenylate cyclase
VFNIRGFSNIAEPYPAEDVVRMLKRYFDAMGVPDLARVKL